MNLKQITETLSERRRHSQLMRAARRAVYTATSPREATPAAVAALAFGMFRLRVDEREAVEFLDAVLVELGESRYGDREDR